MPPPTFHAFLRALPKCEHHMHLEGALRPHILFQLASKNNITLPQDDEAFASPESLLSRYQRFTSLDDFLHYYYIGMSVLITASDFEDLAWDYFLHASADGVAHAEVFFDPQAHVVRAVTYSTVVDGFSRACKRAESELGITTILTSCFLRHLPVQESLDLFDDEEVQKSYRDGTVTGIGLDSSEMDFPPELFVELFAKARKQGLNLTAHAGEEAPASYIATAVSDLRVTRIDHGIALPSSPDLLSQIAASKMLLTVCPLSNVVLRCVDTIADVPIRKLLDAGVQFSINSDDPAYFGGHCLDNHVAVHEAFDLSVDEWVGIVRAGIEGSWCATERKGELLRVLEGVVEEWRHRLV
ncbi:adenosine deaminase [Lentithecium fluviatile CBS 122367]|uniref:Adenine deaminase n=1 Tax=Lentithecium fluviatile CBS 122367 TaxID=1168545 RepID=A0A6G1II02_9PLEO|nr:adenosine deaminase [Lentithecium fluviatile CBS 122367]